MGKKDWTKRVRKALAAGLAGISLVFLPAAPVAQANIWTDVIGGVIGTSAVYNYTLKSLLAMGNDPGQQKKLLDTDMKERGEDTDAQDNELVDSVMRQLIEQGDYAMASNSLPFRWRVNNDDSFNASCSAMDYVSVNKGILKALNYNRDELAGVLSHELIHGLHQHVAYDGAKSLATQFGAALLLRENSGILEGLLAGILLNYHQAKNISVPSENDADRAGFYLMASAGFNPGGFPAMVCKMPDSPDENILYPDDHPETSKRLARSLEWLKTYGIDHVSVEGTTIAIDGKPLLTVEQPMESYSAKETAYFIAGGLAKAFHDNRLATTWHFHPAPGGAVDFLTDEEVYRPLKEAIQTKGLASELERMVTAAYRDDAQTGNREKLLEEEQKYQE
ncbi:MAG: M48 family metalloprotease, partial [Schwartzia sp.]|nr:M48 family metalloprotease [Schwartzia sp. (in: firmicutes)]